MISVTISPNPTRQENHAHDIDIDKPY